ncbi:MAG: hypothetical protein IKS00_07225 [Bacteroidales bacterium]|nr:hypothetical protein [Bacteroidales bacterium]
MKNFAAKFLAVASIFVLLGAFMFGQQLQNLLMKAPFMKIDTYYSGGEIEKTISLDNYSINIYQEVYPALIGEGKEGFRQVAIYPNDSTIKEYNIRPFDIDGNTKVIIENNVATIIDGNGNTSTVKVAKSSKNLIFRIPLNRKI